MKKIIFTIIVFLLGMTFTYAVDLILSKDVIYDNTSSKLNSKNVQDALDELYEKCSNETKDLYVLINSKADKNTNINFSEGSGATGQETNGIYTTIKTNNGKEVYYYRGNVNNNIIFNNMCWKIIRTTETGGVKLIYNGTPSDGKCNNTGENSQIGTSAFNTSYNDNAYVGYMYGNAGSSTYEATHTNTHSSTIKTYIDNWFSTNFDAASQNMLEDTVFCNDRNTKAYDATLLNASWASSYGTLGYGTNTTLYGSAFRAWYYTKTPNPTLVCKNTSGLVDEKNDSFTVSTSKGNGKLTYPVGLITLDEAIYAGFNTYYSNTSDYEDTNNYLYTGSWYWTFSPVISSASLGVVSSGGVIADRDSNSEYGVRPVLSLKSGTKISFLGDGTKENPYIVE